jgi:hypothetical protein
MQAALHVLKTTTSPPYNFFTLFADLKTHMQHFQHWVNNTQLCCCSSQQRPNCKAAATTSSTTTSAIVISQTTGLHPTRGPQPPTTAVTAGRET